MAKQTRFIPKFPEKYMGDPRRIVSRSSWELAYMSALDNSRMVTKWMSEPRNLKITYLDPLTKKVKTYWPDFLIQYADGNIEIVEVKPLKEASLNKAVSQYDKLMLVKNIAKWQSAEQFAKKIGARFRVVTEQQMFGNKSTKSPRPPKAARRVVK